MTKPLYVDMCEKSPMQLHWEPAYGNRAYDDEMEGSVIIIDDGDLQDPKDAGGNPLIWLPRVEEYMDMVTLEKLSITDQLKFMDNAYIVDCMKEWTRRNNMKTMSTSDYWMLVWCLYIHYKKYCMTWFLEDNRWGKA